jgi:hypothetical protein
MTTITLNTIRGNNEPNQVQVPTDRVYLGGEGIVHVDLNPLANCEELELLWLYGNCLDTVDLEPLRHCPRLMSLSLRANRLDSIDLRPLSHCVSLEELDLSGNSITTLDVTPLASCSRVRQLDFSGNPIDSLILYPLQDCKQLSRIIVGGKQREKGQADSCTPQVGHESDNRAVTETLDVTPLFWLDTLTDVELRGNVQLRVDPALKYIAAAKALRMRDTITSSPRTDTPPVLRWMTHAHHSRLTAYDYESEAERVGTEELRKRLDAILSRVLPGHWFHAQKGLLEGFGLGYLSGYDGDPILLTPLEDCGSDFSKLKQSLLQRAIELIRAQVKRRGPTLFIDVHSLLAIGEPKLADRIIHLRQKEMDSVVVPLDRGQADISELKLTSYGHSLLSALGEERSRIPVTDLDRVACALADAGFRLRSQERSVTGNRGAKPRVTQSFFDFVLVDRLDKLMKNTPSTECNSSA